MMINTRTTMMVNRINIMERRNRDKPRYKYERNMITQNERNVYKKIIIIKF